jgi:YfiH family protein
MKNKQLAFKSWVPAQWPVPPGIHAGTTTRIDGNSCPPYDRFNLAMHVGDNPAHVKNNRYLLCRNLQLPSEPVWLAQTHSNQIVDATNSLDNNADGAYTQKRGVVCAVLTADCLPLMLCNDTGTQIAAIHVGWKGFCSGIIPNAIHSFQTDDILMAWLGPCIRVAQYEVGADVYAACTHYLPESDVAFIQSRPDHWQADLPLLVKLDLHRSGIIQIYDSDFCTCMDEEHFFSYRREGETGRMASLIWMDAT